MPNSINPQGNRLPFTQHILLISPGSQMTMFIAPDKKRYPDKCFLISPQKGILWLHMNDMPQFSDISAKIFDVSTH